MLEEQTYSLLQINAAARKGLCRAACMRAHLTGRCSLGELQGPALFGLSSAQLSSARGQVSAGDRAGLFAAAAADAADSN